MLGLAGECNELVSVCQSRGTLRNGPTVEIVQASIPDDLEVLSALLVGVDPERVRRAHDNAIGSHEHRRLGSSLPPDDLRLDLLELSKSAINALPRGE